LPETLPRTTSIQRVLKGPVADPDEKRRNGHRRFLLSSCSRAGVGRTRPSLIRLPTLQLSYLLGSASPLCFGNPIAKRVPQDPGSIRRLDHRYVPDATMNRAIYISQKQGLLD
jgi:hypothetical protein